MKVNIKYKINNLLRKHHRDYPWLPEIQKRNTDYEAMGNQSTKMVLQYWIVRNYDKQ